MPVQELKAKPCKISSNTDCDKADANHIKEHLNVGVKDEYKTEKLARAKKTV